MRAAAVLILLAGRAAAEGPPRHHVNFRAGATGDDLGARDELCLEVAPIAALSLEGCGNGSGFLHTEPVAELAHFRAKLRVASWATRGVRVEPQVALGFAELQLGEDAPGFDFGGTDAARGSTAGPEAGLWLRALVPLDGGFEGVAAIGVSLAYLAHADALVRPQPAVQPSLGGTFGLSF